MSAQSSAPRSAPLPLTCAGGGTATTSLLPAAIHTALQGPCSFNSVLWLSGGDKKEKIVLTGNVSDEGMKSLRFFFLSGVLAQNKYRPPRGRLYLQLGMIHVSMLTFGGLWGWITGGTEPFTSGSPLQLCPGSVATTGGCHLLPSSPPRALGWSQLCALGQMSGSQQAPSGFFQATELSPRRDFSPSLRLGPGGSGGP